MMKLGSLTISTAVVLGVIAGAALWLSWCHDPSVRAEALLTVAGDTTDARVARLAADQLEREAAWRRRENVIQQESAKFRHRADSLAQQVATFATSGVPDSGTFVPKVVALAALAAKDSVITSERQRAAFYQGQVASYRDTILPALQRLNADLTAQRNSWRGRAQPGLVTRLIRAAPFLAGAYLLGRAKVP